MAYFNPDDYIDVQARINRFWTEYPDGAIRTLHVGPIEDFTKTRYRAEIYKDKTNPHPDAVGYAFELAGGGGANKTSHEENCETSAIGRALANMGYATSGKDRPSREEMEKVQRHQEDPPLPPEPEWAHEPSQQVSRAPAASQAPEPAMIHHGDNIVPRPTPSPNGSAPAPNIRPMSDKQKQLLNILMTERNISDTDVEDWLSTQKYKETWPNISSPMASRLISAIKEGTF